MCTLDRGDYLKVEFAEDATGVVEWVRRRMDCCDLGEAVRLRNTG